MVIVDIGIALQEPVKVGSGDDGFVASTAKLLLDRAHLPPFPQLGSDRGVHGGNTGISESDGEATEEPLQLPEEDRERLALLLISTMHGGEARRVGEQLKGEGKKTTKDAIETRVDAANVWFP